MHDSDQLIVFARAPLLGGVKQRLARDIGKAAALAFYQENLQSLLQRLIGGPWELSVSVAGDDQHPVFKGFPTTVQANGDLGQRMKHALQQSGQQRRVIIGSDIPMIERIHIEEAFAALEQHELVFGPATDGGFWAIGCNENVLLQDPSYADFMRGVRWSSEYALADTIASLPLAVQENVAQTSTLSDVDDGPSYDAYLSAAAAGCEDRENPRGNRPGYGSGNT